MSTKDKEKKKVSKKTDRYIFKYPFEYAYDGDMAKSQFITIKPPNSRMINNIAPVKANLMRALNHSTTEDDKTQLDLIDSLEPGEKPPEKKEVELTPLLIMAALEFCPEGVDVAIVINNVMEMVCSGLGKLDGETKCTKPMRNEIHWEDQYGITGFFLINFILPSLQ